LISGPRAVAAPGPTGQVPSDVSTAAADEGDDRFRHPPSGVANPTGCGTGVNQD